VLKAGLWLGVLLQIPQNPSPMTETARPHTRVSQKATGGQRQGRMLAAGRAGPKSPVVFHFHGAGWLAEQAAVEVFRDVTIGAIQVGSGSAVYDNAFREQAAFDQLLLEAGARDRPVILSGFSAGYGAIRAILKHSADRVAGILLMDGLHASYDPGRTPIAADLESFVPYAREAAAGRRKMLITHSEVYPGTFASTTETTDWLIRELGLTRRPILRWGPAGMQQISESRRGRLAILGFAGNTGPDHTDHFHAMAAWLRLLRKL
jgi:hypothetical protein